jgi:phosphate/sulfate permease
VIEISRRLGIPVSTIHVIFSSILGVGAIKLDRKIVRH